MQGNGFDKLFQTPRCDDGNAFLVDAGVVKLAGRQIRRTPVGGDGGDEDDFVREVAAEFGLEEVVAFALDAKPDGVAEQEMVTCWFAVSTVTSGCLWRQREHGFEMLHGDEVMRTGHGFLGFDKCFNIEDSALSDGQV